HTRFSRDWSSDVCSSDLKHISARFIDGGGVSFSENLSVSTQVAARIGIPVIADASASHSSSRTARAEYRLTGKIVAEIADPEARSEERRVGEGRRRRGAR